MQKIILIPKKKKKKKFKEIYLFSHEDIYTYDIEVNNYILVFFFLNPGMVNN